MSIVKKVVDFLSPPKKSDTDDGMRFSHKSDVVLPSQYSKLRSENIEDIKKTIRILYDKYEKKELLVFKESSSVPKWCAKVYDLMVKNSQASNDIKDKMFYHIQVHEHNIILARKTLTDFIVFVIQKINNTSVSHKITFSGELTPQSRVDLILQIPHSFQEENEFTVKRVYADPTDNKKSNIKYIPEKYTALFDIIYSAPAFELEQLESNVRALKRLFL